MNQLHPVFQMALAPWIPRLSDNPPKATNPRNQHYEEVLLRALGDLKNRTRHGAEFPDACWSVADTYGVVWDDLRDAYSDEYQWQFKHDEVGQ